MTAPSIPHQEDSEWYQREAAERHLGVCLLFEARRCSALPAADGRTALQYADDMLLIRQFNSWPKERRSAYLAGIIRERARRIRADEDAMMHRPPGRALIGRN